ncbi:MAG: signal peptide peptidase SppA, partial [Propionibacteriaceae bacterium]
FEPPPPDPPPLPPTLWRRALRPTLRALHEAADDPRVAGLVARVGGALSWSTMQELRLGVHAFAASGKPTVAWAESFDGSMTAYVLATAFGEIWLQPGGGLGPLGMGVETTFLGGVLTKIGVEPQLEQRKEYKNAVDRLTRTEFTAPHRESLDALVGSIFDDAVTAVAQDRALDADRVRELVDVGFLTAAEALRARLVDRLGYRDEVYAALRSGVTETTGTAPDLLFADRWSPRAKPVPTLLKHVPGRHPGEVALVEVRGAIASGRSRRGANGRQVGSDSVAAELRAATTDENVRAVVLHVDSPGGSAVASDTIWREVTRVRDAGKPVVVAMGGAAASGGYYLACPADVIVALPATLTGSIGVFGGKFVLTNLLGRIGVSTGSVQRGERALMYSARRGFSDGERDRLAAGIDAIYDDFVAKVAQGRGRTVAEVEEVARGRVWSGADALEVGLVDELGGLRDAVRLARERADLPPDAPVRRALQVSPLSRLTPARNSEDPRAQLQAVRSALPDLQLMTRAVSELGVLLGGAADDALRMPAITLH